MTSPLPFYRAALLIPLLSAGLQAAAGLLAGSNLRTCDKVAPVGVDARPYFGWMPVATGAGEAIAAQRACRLQVASTAALLKANTPDVWDSGLAKGSLVNMVPYAGPALLSDTRYYWRVQLVDGAGNEGAWSAVAHFDTGLLKNDDWSGAAWIRRPSEEPNDYTLYRRDFALPASKVMRAVLHITSCHKYEVSLNGTQVGSGPAYHEPQFQYYNSYDVTTLLRAGAGNVLAVFNRWWGPGQGRPPAERGLIAKLVLHMEDGRTQIVGTDGEWRTHSAPQWELGTAKRNRTNGTGFVEKIRASAIIDGWDKPGFDASTWDKATVLGAHPTKPWSGILQTDLTRMHEEEVPAVSWTKLGEGHYIADFGKVRAGRPAVNFSAGEAGRVVRMLGGFTLEADGKICVRTNQKTDLSYTFELDGKARRFMPAEYHGMRYLEIENAPAGLALADVRFVSRTYELEGLRDPEVIARFDTDNPTLNAVWKLMVDSIPVCTQEQFIDTPTREKGGFLGDAWSESVAAMLVGRDRTMTRRTLAEFPCSQESLWPGDGRMNDVYPYHKQDDIPDYNHMYVAWIWDYYRETGDLVFLERQYEALRKVMVYELRSLRADTGLVTNLEGGRGDYLGGIVDWPKSGRYGYDMTAAARTVINTFTWQNLRVMTDIATLLGKQEDAAHYASKAEALGKAINTQLVNADGIYHDGIRPDGKASPHLSQQANTMPLAMGLVPAERRAAVAAHVKSLRMASGMVTLRWLIDSIGESGDGAHLVELFTNKEWDGWAKCLERGATCTWESWNAIDGTESLSHAWGAVGTEGLVRYVLGISPLEPQYARVRIRPLHFGAALSRASGSIPTDRGTVAVAWRLQDKAVTLDVDIPLATTAEIWVPATGGTLLLDNREVSARSEPGYLVTEVGPGRHTLRAGSGH